MEAIKAKYKNGRVYLSRKPKVERESKVTVLFPDNGRKKRVVGLNGKQMRKLVGVIALGGDAVEDTEKLYS
ncbi:MAG: hypothetical protein AAB209_13890 [Bacteroidota bacterium]|jgi:hypothetical protein